MLSPLRRPQVSLCTRYAWRFAYSTEAQHHHTPARPPPAQNCINVKLPNGLKNMAEILAVVRCVEGEVGRVKDYIFPRDPYDRQNYMRTWLNLRLQNAADWERIPETPIKMKVEIPVMKSIPAGGLGIAEIEHLLYSNDRVRDDHFETLLRGDQQPNNLPKIETIEVEVEIARTNFGPHFNRKNRDTLIGPERLAEFGRAFALWGGFYQQSTPAALAETKAQTDDLPPTSNVPLHLGTADEPQTAPSPTEEGTLAEAYIPEPDTPRMSVGKALEVLRSQAEASAPTDDPPPVTVPLRQRPKASESPLSAQLFPEVGQQRGRSKRRERLLDLARLNAQQPLPPSAFPPPPKPVEEKREEIEEQQAQARATKASIRERLWRLMGGRI